MKHKLAITIMQQCCSCHGKPSCWIRRMFHNLDCDSIVSIAMKQAFHEHEQITIEDIQNGRV